MTRCIIHCIRLPALLCAATLAAQNTPITGVVYADRNGNGTRDAGERGVPGVIVSNQTDVVLTDSAGRFQFAVAPSGVVFVSVPSDYRAVGSFWHAVSTPGQSLDFAIQPEKQSRSFSFVHASDTHIAPANVENMRRFRSLVDSARPALVLILGDLVRDAMSVSQAEAESYVQLFKTETAQIAPPVWTVPGNHDHYGIIRSRSHADPANPMYGRGMYHHYFGPDYYSFNYGGVHFIGLNTVQPDDSAYYGYVDSLQLAWLKKDVATVPAAMPIVTFDHIPLASWWWSVLGPDDEPLVGDIARASGRPTFRHTVGNTPDIIDAMKGHNYALALGAHMHVPEKIEVMSNGKPIRFENSPAIAGGPKVPPFEYPPGFSIYRVKDGVIDRGTMVLLNLPKP